MLVSPVIIRKRRTITSHDVTLQQQLNLVKKFLSLLHQRDLLKMIFLKVYLYSGKISMEKT